MPTIRFRHVSATATVNLVDPKLGFLNSVYSRVRREGHATALMNQVIAWADENEVMLLLTAQTYGSESTLSNQALVEFYRRFGFKDQMDLELWPRKMYRAPRKKYNAHNEEETLRRR